MVLVDTSVWVDHLRNGNKLLVSLLEDNEVWLHPFVTGELACGNLKARDDVLGLLKKMPQIKKATDDEVLFYIQEQDIAGKGIGYVDAHLLASVALANDTVLWTLDKRLASVAEEL